MDQSRPPRFTLPSRSDQLLVRAAIGGDDVRECWERWLAGVVYDDVPYREARLIPQVFASFQRRGIGDVLPPRMRGQYRWVFASNQLRCHAVAPALDRLATSRDPDPGPEGRGAARVGSHVVGRP